jgi:hypothetical protein
LSEPAAVKPLPPPPPLCRLVNATTIATIKPTSPPPPPIIMPGREPMPRRSDT